METMMKPLNIVITFAIASTLYAEPVATAEDAPMNEINQHIQALISQHRWPPNDEVAAEHVFQSIEFIQLKECATAHWDSLSRNWDSVFGGDAGNFILLHALQDLDADNYMTVLERLTEKFHQGKISKTAMQDAFFPYYGRMRGFLTNNYRHTRVQALFKSLKPYFEDDPNIRRWIREVLSGRAKKEDEAFEKAHKGMQKTPQVLLEGDGQNQNRFTDMKPVLWGLPLLVGSLLVWWYFRKRKRQR